jgi:hypothetical protein
VPGILWLASYPKSGNTWTRIFIGHLLGLINGDPDVEQSVPMLSKYTVDVSFRKLYETFLSADQIDSDHLSVLLARPHVQQLFAAGFGHSGFAKTHSAALSVRGVSQINLGVTRGAVYIVRNPLDVVCSFGPYFGVPLAKAVRNMNDEAFCQPADKLNVTEIISSWSRHVASWIESPINPFVMRYEDMLAEPSKAFTAFTHHANIPATPEQIERAIELSAFSRLKEKEEAEGFDQRVTARGLTFFRAGKSEQWRDTLKPKQVDRIVADHGKWMERFGYLPG